MPPGTFEATMKIAITPVFDVEDEAAGCQRVHRQDPGVAREVDLPEQRSLDDDERHALTGGFR
jgi:hypothetical protein